MLASKVKSPIPHPNDVTVVKNKPKGWRVMFRDVKMRTFYYRIDADKYAEFLKNKLRERFNIK